ncbi:H-NS family nucleoid-associated regulatory protein [Paraburkholderia sediminicola]|uniref:H-NS family nucleoid-associated regulatory protein n=1 Tax=Paraburkholderia sediminicola TaxID=458836 RepID=UPI0038BCEA80
MATLKQIQAKLKRLQAQADALLAKKAQAAVDQIRALMLRHGLTTADIENNATAARVAKGQKVSAAAGKTRIVGGVKVKAAPKYQHPKTGATWTGHGRAPTWIAEAKDRNKFLIAGGAEATAAANVGGASKAKKESKAVGATSTKGQPKGPQPAKYRDPKSGATWSGRGPAPTWLAGAKDRTKFLIDGVNGVADSTAASKPKTVAKKPATKTAVAKKEPAKKLVAAKKVRARTIVAAAPEAAAA